LASKKGIAITAAIVAGIIAASLAIWLAPQNAPSATNITDNEIAPTQAANLPADNLSFVYTEHSLTTTEVSNAFEKWTKGEADADEVNGAVAKARSEAQTLHNRLSGQLPEEWKQSYSLYSQALDKFNSYLDEMKRIVDSGDRNADQSKLASIKQEMDGLVEQSIKSFPT
jgi:uncharacterized protein Yka (UPF0111/DUF47 family)